MNPIAFVFALLALVGTLVAGAMFGKNLSDKAQSQADVDYVRTVIANVQHHYLTQPSYAGISTASEIANGDIAHPVDGSGMLPGGSTLVILGPLDVSGGSANAVQIEVQKLAVRSCMEIARQLTIDSISNETGLGVNVNTPGRGATEVEATNLCQSPMNNLFLVVGRTAG